MRFTIKLLLATILLTGSTYTIATAATVQTDSSVVAERNVSGFNQLKIAGPFEVHITQGTVESLKLTAPAEIMNRIVTGVSGKTLRIHNAHDNWSQGEKSWYSDKGWWHKHKEKIQVYLTVISLKSITVSGSGGASFENGLTANSLRVRVRGSGSMLGKIDVKTLKSLISGSGHIKLSGNAEISHAEVKGSGSFEARDLVTLNSAVRVSGSGDAKINANERVDAAISGSGGVQYTGTAKTINSTKSGSGNISRL